VRNPEKLAAYDFAAQKRERRFDMGQLERYRSKKMVPL
jgi:hypothetical protein